MTRRALVCELREEIHCPVEEARAIVGRARLRLREDLADAFRDRGAIGDAAEPGKLGAAWIGLAAPERLDRIESLVRLEDLRRLPHAIRLVAIELREGFELAPDLRRERRLSRHGVERLRDARGVRRREIVVDRILAIDPAVRLFDERSRALPPTEPRHSERDDETHVREREPRLGLRGGALAARLLEGREQIVELLREELDMPCITTGGGMPEEGWDVALERQAAMHAREEPIARPCEREPIAAHEARERELREPCRADVDALVVAIEERGCVMDGGACDARIAGDREHGDGAHLEVVGILEGDERLERDAV